MRTVNLRSNPRPATLIVYVLIGMSAMIMLRSPRSTHSIFPAGVSAVSKARSAPVSAVSGESAISGLPPGKAKSVMGAYARLPLSFERREHSSDEFYSRGQGYSLALTAQQVTLTLRQSRRNWPTRRQIFTSRDDDEDRIESQALSLTMRLLNANPSSRGEALDQLP